MIKLFKNIRKKLVEENNSVNRNTNYFKYAIGEIILVVIGILIALSINNWNETTKKDETFNAILEQIYNVLDRESEMMLQTNIGLQLQISVIDSILKNPHSIDKKLLPSLLFYLEKNPDNITSEAAYQLSFLEFDPKNYSQSKISKSLTYYVNYDNLNFSENQKKYLSPLLHSLNIPEPDLLFGHFALNNFENADPYFFTEEQQNMVLESVTNDKFQNALKSIKNQKQTFIFNVNGIISEAKLNLKQIKTYYPEAKLFYTEVGILGTATEKDWVETLFMKATNTNLSIWEGDFILNDGFVKFRCGNNWTDNWGGDTFPKGRANYFGENIPIKAGNYHVILNLTEKTYQFILKTK